MSDNNFNVFPKTDMQALAFLYVQNQDLSGKSPAEVYETYLSAYYEILKEHRQKSRSGWFSQMNAKATQD